MAKVTLTDPADNPAATESAKLIAASRKSVDVTDELGRVITLKKPAPLAKLDFAKAAGSSGMNQLYLAEVAHLQFVSAIDGAPVITPSTDGELRALYSRLGDEGNEAAQLGVYENFMKDQPASAEIAKNS